MANVTVNIENGDDDGHEQQDGSGFTSAETAIRVITRTTANGRRTCLMRFVIPEIANGDTIDAAVLNVDIDNNDNVEATIRCEDVDDSVDLVDDADIIDRPTTTAGVAWVESSMGDGAQTTPDFTAVVQEVIDRGGWSAGNGLSVIISGDNAAEQICFISSFENADPEAQIDIDYTVSGAPDLVSVAPPVVMVPTPGVVGY